VTNALALVVAARALVTRTLSLPPGCPAPLPVSTGILDERLRNQLHVHPVVLGPVVVVLGQTVGGTDNIEKPSPGVAYLSAAVFSFLTTGLFDWLGCSTFCTGLFDRLVVFRERAIGKGAPEAQRCGQLLLQS